MKTIVLNSTNFVPGSGNVFQYNFPSAVSFAKGDRIGLASLSVTNSTYNISAARANNTVTIQWPTITPTSNYVKGQTSWSINYTMNSYPFFIPDGYYTVSQLNTYLQLQMFNQGLYMTSNAGASTIYFFNIVAVTQQYGVQISAFQLPSFNALQTNGWAPPTGTVPTLPIPGLTGALNGTTYANAGGNKNFWCPNGFGGGISSATNAYPNPNSAALSPILTVPASFGALLGFPPTSLTFTGPVGGNFSNSYTAAATLFQSSQTPIISPVNSYILTCSLLNNPYAVPMNVFYTVPLSVPIGGMIVVNSPQFILNDIYPNVYNQFFVTFYDQLFNNITLQDVSITLTLVVKEAGEP